MSKIEPKGNSSKGGATFRTEVPTPKACGGVRESSNYPLPAHTQEVISTSLIHGQKGKGPKDHG